VAVSDVVVVISSGAIARLASDGVAGVILNVDTSVESGSVVESAW